MSRFLGTLLLSTCLLAPVAARAEDHHDAAAARSHEWNDHEESAWHNYLKENHKKDHEWAKASKRDQKKYWKWREAHPD
jgi:hypothetical protein